MSWISLGEVAVFTVFIILELCTASKLYWLKNEGHIPVLYGVACRLDRTHRAGNPVTPDQAGSSRFQQTNPASESVVFQRVYIKPIPVQMPDQYFDSARAAADENVGCSIGRVLTQLGCNQFG
ncbi:MAG: hypothetical protein ACI8VW_002733 [bacterium]|jgi:hypothetical protein